MSKAYAPTVALKALSLVAVVCLATTLDATAADAGAIVKTVFPTEIEDSLGNPYMGWGIWAGPRYFDGRVFTLDYNTTGFGDEAPLFNWVLIDWMWADLEPQEGQYYWKDLDAVINYWAARGKQIDLRVWITDDPGWNGKSGSEVCPEWLWKAGGRYHEYLGEGKSKKREPDYLDPSYEKIYLPKVRKFLSALAERYDRPDSPIVMWGAMGYGQWGEWHTNWSRYPWPSLEVKHNVLTKVVNMYSDIFKVRQLRIACAPDNYPKVPDSLADYLYGQAVDVAISRGFALANHGFIGQGSWCRPLVQKYWREIPFYAESNWSYTDVKNHHTHGTLDEYLEVYSAWHANYAHYYMDSESYNRAMREDRAHFEQGLKRGGLGYRLVLTSASWREEVPAGHAFLLRQTWVNRNVGRLYVRHPLKLYLTDAEGNEKFSVMDSGFDQTQWVAGENYRVISVFYVPKDMAPGIYDVRIAMADRAGNPRINLAIEGADTKRRYNLGSVRILPFEAGPGCIAARCP